MTIIADIVMLFWPVLVIALFSRMKSEKAVVVAFVVGWMFLPFKTYPLTGLPDITKMSLTCYAIIAATLVFDMERFTSFRPKWWDLPIVVVCLAPGISSIINNLGPYDAASAMLSTTVAWAGPYLLGRVYLVDTATLRFAAIAMLVGTLIYLPLCWFEIRMSPQLHLMVYGKSYRFSGMRLGGWRPVVFMDSGLQLGLWMTTASLTGIWLCWTGVWKRCGGVAVLLPLSALILTTIFCRSTGALVLLMLGLAVLAWTRLFHNRLALIALLAVAPTYIVMRSMGDDSWGPALQLIESVSPERAESLHFRFANEDILVAKAMRQPVFGWGGWGRSRVYDEFGKDISVTDGLWIIEFGEHGLVGLVSLFALLLAPLTLLIIKFPARQLVSSELAPALALAISVTLFAIDCLPNAMPNPFYLMTAGGVIGYVLAYRESVPETKKQTVSTIALRKPLRRLRAGSPLTSQL